VCDTRSTPGLCQCGTRIEVGASGATQGLTVYCSGRPFDRVPVGIPSNASVIYMSSMPSSSFNLTFIGNFTRLRELHMISNQFTSLPATSTAFESLNNPFFSRFLLSRGMLSRIDSGTFSSLTFMRALSLSGNRITLIAPDAFANLSRLNSLSLDMNRVSSLSPTLFSPLPSVSTLNVSNNLITALPPGLISTCLNLASFSAASNLITSIPQGFFTGLISLFNIDLSENLITEIPPGLFADQTATYAL
jgi:Leucine-rich repeat (LRR) protein